MRKQGLGVLCFVFCLFYSLRAGADNLQDAANIEETQSSSAVFLLSQESKNDCPVSPKTKHYFYLSENCSNLLLHVEQTIDRIRNRLVAGWEYENDPYSRTRFHLGGQRILLNEAVKVFETMEAEKLLRGRTALLTGWGNCGEHASLAWSGLIDVQTPDGIMGCKGARVFYVYPVDKEFPVDPSCGINNPVHVDHVWIEVWVPKTDLSNGDSILVEREFGVDEPRIIEEILDGKDGYFITYDATQGDFPEGPYRVVRTSIWMRSKPKTLWTFKQIPVFRSELKMSRVTKDLIFKTQQIAEDIFHQLIPNVK